MNQSISNAMLFYLVIIFVVILMAFFIGSLGYSKASKVKNRIVEEIEKNEDFNKNVQSDVDTWLANIGYRVNANHSFKCPKYREQSNINDTSKYQYCVYKIDTCKENKSKCGAYYRVVAYMYFDVPIIGQLIQVPVRGETMTFYELKS